MKYVKYLLVVISFAFILVGGLLFKNSFKDHDVLDEIINFDELDDDFMNNYYKGTEEILNEGNEDNVLIIVSKKKPKDVYGAKRVVEAPNNTYILEYKTEQNMDEAKKNFESDKNTYSVIKNRKYTLMDDESNNYNSWGIQKAGLDNAIKVVNQKGGESVTAAIIDTGCDMELFNASYEGKIEEVYNLYETSIYGNDNMFDHFGHGTHIAGTIAEGTSDNVKILPVKVSDDSSMSTVAILDAIYYIAENHKADVINMSFGARVGNDYSIDFSNDPEYVAIETARRENIISVVAAGNDNTDDIDVPAFFDNTISISAVDQNLDKANFSNYGPKVDFAAPGVDILSINGVKSGTSMAAPHGVCAVSFLKSLKKDLSLEETIDALKSNSIDLGAKGKDDYFGYGFIDLSSVKICDEYSTGTCTELGIEGDVEPTRIEVSEVVLTPYNYGSINNILATKVKLIDDKDKYEIKSLDKLDDVVIDGYNPYSSEKQTVNINYLGMETSFEVTNPTDYEIGWLYDYDMFDGITTDKYTIYGYKDNNLEVEKLYFPKKINGIDVISISSRWPSSMFKESNDAHYYREVYLPDTLRKIGSQSFYGISNVYKIKSDAEDLELSAAALNDLKYLTTVDANIYFEQYASSAFSGDYSLKEVRLSPRTTVIPQSTFYGCTALKNIDIPDGVTKIDNYAFYYSGINSIILPANIETIGIRSFAETKIEEVYIPKFVSNIGDNAFGGLSLNKIVVDEENSSYDSRDNCNCIIESGAKKLIIGSRSSVIPDGIKRIENHAFFSSSIKNVTIPDSVESIGYEAFTYADFLSEVVVPASVTSIEERAFYFTGWNAGVGTVFKIYSSTYVHDYVLDNDFVYVLLDKTPNVPKIEVGYFYSGAKNQYLPFEQVLFDGQKVKIKYYDIDELETITEFKKVVYENGDSFRFGDWSYELYFDSATGYYNLHGPWYVDVGKLTPEYEVPEVYANVNSTLADVDLPKGFEWEDSSIQLTETGNKVYDARFIPEDTNNYEIVEDIAVSVHVINKTLVKPSIIVEDKVYDGTTDLSLDSITISDISEDDYSIESVMLDDANAGPRKALIKLKLKDDKFTSYSFSNGKQEKVFECDTNVLPERLIRPTLVPNQRYIYNGNMQSIKLNNYNNKKMDISNNRQKNAGSYSAIVSLKSKNYIWEDGGEYPTYLYYTIEKADIDYYSDDVEIIYDGLEHEIILYTNFYDENTRIKFMDDHGNYTLDDMPMYSDPGVYLIKYMITVDDNYKVAYGENTLTIKNSGIVNNTNDVEVIYDGSYHSINLDVSVDNYLIHYSVNNTNYDLNELPLFKDVGEYTINYIIESDGYESVTGSNKVKIYGVKEIDSSVTQKEDMIVTDESSFNNLVDKITTYSTSTTFEHYDKSNQLVDSDSIKTGDIVKITINNSTIIEYKIALLGDANGDGEIGILDYIAIMKDIMGTSKLSGIYYEAADMNKNNSIDILDYISVMKIIMEEK